MSEGIPVSFQDSLENPYLHGPYAPVHQEITAEHLEVIGEIPEDLLGVYVRNGPNPKYRAQGRHHWFDGDGMLHAVYFERGGKVTYRNRYVGTAAHQRENAANASLWRGLMEPAIHNPKDMLIKDTANTDVIFHDGQLMSLWYLAGQPYRVDARTLETIKADDFHGKLSVNVSAHAKVDAQTGEAFFFDQNFFQAPHMSYGVVDKDSNLVNLVPIDVPGPRQPHDMAITQNYAIVMDLSLFADPEALKVGRYKIGFHRDVPSRFGIIPRMGDATQLRWFEADPCFIYHVVNAWEEGDEVRLIACRVKTPEPKVEGNSPLSKMMAYLRLDAHLYEWRFNMKTGETTERALDDANTEFPSIRASLCGQKSRYAYNMHLSDEPTLLFDGIFKFDFDTGAIAKHWFGEGRYGSEAPFAPKASQGGEVAEDEGYLVSFVHDTKEDRSEVVILDAQDVEGEPIARVLLPQRVPLGFHAAWIPESELPPR